MPATVTLSATTLAAPVDEREKQIKVASTSGLVAGTRLYVDRELMAVTSLDVSPLVNVRRGVDGTTAAPHTSGVMVLIGAADQYYSVDPQGVPGEAVLVAPYVNIRTGDAWVSQGDVTPVGNSNRWWQKVTVTYAIGALGIRTVTYDPTTST